jgi:hypothetical protein
VGNYVLMMEMASKKHRGWLGGFGLNGLWSVGSVLVAQAGAVAHRMAEKQALGIKEWQAVSLTTMVSFVYG